MDIQVVFNEQMVVRVVRIVLLGVCVVISIVLYIVTFDKLIALAISTGSSHIARLSVIFSSDSKDVALIEKLVSRNKLAPVDLKQASLIRKLIKDGDDIDAVNKINGNTALISAAKKMDVNTVRFLLSNGADPNIKNNNGSTAAILVCAQEPKLALEILKLLFKAGADLSLENLEYQNCRSLALTRSHQALVSNNGVDVVLEFLDSYEKQ